MAESHEVTLLGTRVSVFVNRVQFSLNLKSIKYKFLEEDLQAKSELLLKSNPVQKKVPVLIHGGKSIIESLVIIQYIDDCWPENGPNILPADPYDRAQVRFWSAYIDDKLFSALLKWLLEEQEESRAESLQKMIESLALLEEVLVKCSNGKDYFGGDDLGYIDIVLGSLLGGLKAVEIDSGVKILDETKIPAIAKWAEKFVSHEAVKGTLPEPEELLGLMRTRQARQEASK